MIDNIRLRLMEGGEITVQEALELINIQDKSLLYKLAQEITESKAPNDVDLCSIINVKSGRCPEDCKWCAQSIHYNTSAEEYTFVDKSESLRHALYNESQGVRRFSLVASGRRVSQSELKKAVETYTLLKQKSSIRLCASLGLARKEDLQALKDAGVETYHCNLESSPSHFAELCTTHTQKQKIDTLMWAHEVGMKLCSGGIIGMGETMEQRVELAFTLKQLPLFSIPINILHPIAGTPLAGTPKLTDEEILTTIAIFRLIHPDKYLRFSGGRMLMSRELQKKAIEIGINSAIVGDLLTTIGSSVTEDKELFGMA
ncbi:MAG: biotin synthase BioB [Bacteroidales bacterium]